MTDKSEKVDGYVLRSPGALLCESRFFSHKDDAGLARVHKPKPWEWEVVPVRIIPATEPTAAEARQAVISELLEWCHGQRNIDHDSLDAKLRKLERVK